MSDPRFQSLYLEDEPRREQFRAARQLIRAACGDQTIAGDALRSGGDDVWNAPTIGPPPESPFPSSNRFTFYLKDGMDVFPLHIGLNSVGRLPDNDVVIRDECVSRRHCAVVVHSDFRCELHDVASKNGTQLNGAKIAGPTRLQSGDRILLCTHQLTFHISEAHPARG